MFSIRLVLLVALSVHGIKLPGDCPKDVPPSMGSEAGCLPSLLIIAGVPFSDDHSSNLFRQFGFRNIMRSSLTCDHLNGFLSYKMFGSSFSNLLTVHTKEISKQNGILDLKSTVFIKNMMCYTETIDKVHIWLEDDLIILWSCIEGTVEEFRQHDEAVLIFAQDYSFNIWDAVGNGISSLTRRLQNVSTKFLSAALIEKIPWYDPNKENVTNIVEGAYDCSQVGTVKFNELSKIIGVYVVIISLVVVVFYRKKLRYKLCLPNRKIHPVDLI